MSKNNEYGEDKGLKPSNKKKKDARKTAVAIEDQFENRQVPKITAAGRGEFAEKIIALALENGVRIREDSDLAQMLANIEIDSPIPTEAFAAIAEILCYVYQANGQPNPFDAVLEEGEG